MNSGHLIRVLALLKDAAPVWQYIDAREPKPLPAAEKKSAPCGTIDEAKQALAGILEFLKAEYGIQSTSMAAILQHIDDAGLAADVDHIAGPEFLKAVRNVQPRYEAMVKERLRRDNASGQDLRESACELQAAIVNYAAKIIGTIEHDEPETAEAARLALLPITNFREAAAARAQRAAPEDAPAPAKPEPS